MCNPWRLSEESYDTAQHSQLTDQCSMHLQGPPERRRGETWLLPGNEEEVMIFFERRGAILI